MKKYQELWHDIDTSKNYIVNNNKSKECNNIGREVNIFIPYCTGNLDYKDRVIYSAKSGKRNFLPEKPPCDLDKILMGNPTSYFGVRKADGYAQFPRPLTSRTEVRTLYFTNERPFVSKQIHTSNTQRTIKSSKHKSGIKNNTINSAKPSKTYFRPCTKNHFHSYNIKSCYHNLIKGTLKNFNNTERINEKVIKAIKAKDDEGDESERNKERICRSYKEIQEKLLHEKKMFLSLELKQEKKSRLQIKGTYDIIIPNESDLYRRSMQLKGLVNPKAIEKEMSNRILDDKLIKKRREQKLLEVIERKTHARKIN